MKHMIRFPNESCFQEASIDISKFKPEMYFENETFGWYGDIYISILKKK